MRELIVDGPHEGLAAARARGQRLGRPPAMTDQQIWQAPVLLTRPDESVSSVARLLGISRTTLYKHVPELARGGRATVEGPPEIDHGRPRARRCAARPR